MLFKAQQPLLYVDVEILNDHDMTTLITYRKACQSCKIEASKNLKAV